MLAAFWDPARYLLPFPVAALIAAILFLAVGLSRGARSRAGPPRPSA